MALTPLPDPPQTSDPANFATKADALVAALAVLVTEINAGGIEYTGGIMTGLVTANAGIALPTGQTLSGAGSISITGNITGVSGTFSGAVVVPNNVAFQGKTAAGVATDLLYMDTNNIAQIKGVSGEGIAVPVVVSPPAAAATRKGTILVDGTNANRLIFHDKDGARWYVTGTTF